MIQRRILIVGGGSSGWIASAYLDAALNRSGNRRAEITVLESPNVPRIGVGEATIPSINHILAVIGIEQHEFMRRVDGTFKQGIKFVNWLDGSGEHYYHAFGRHRPGPIDMSSLNWLMSDRSVPFSETVSAQPAICELTLAPQMLGQWNFGRRLTHAYHMNALKFADYLCELATSRGVKHHLDDMVDVDVAESGDIAAVRTRGGERLEADLFVDCTGFAALLIEKALGVQWVDCSQWLLCDRAVTMQVPYERWYPGYVRPYTTATALSAGWVWEIPLQDKRSLGYVHSSSFVGEDEAQQEIRSFEGSHAQDLDARFLHFKVGHRAKAWVRNCVAIGLSGSFIEPLESTGLYLSDLASVMLAEHFPLDGEMAPLALRFNRVMANRFYEILDFINLHYCLTRRRDTPFWREVRCSKRIHPRLQAKLDFWRSKPPSPADFEDQFFPGRFESPLPSGGLPGDHRPPIDTAGVFTLSSYEAVLYGMDFLRDECDRWFGNDRPPTVVPEAIAARVYAAPTKLPPHDVWLQRVLGMCEPPSG
ncbi:MAG TPA: tryptophan halogenase family protein [Woeseiaceae bacterium]|nr:tryptophan halogenase family protein [Woeseiaceae bacterium]